MAGTPELMRHCLSTSIEADPTWGVACSSVGADSRALGGEATRVVYDVCPFIGGVAGGCELGGCMLECGG